MRHGLTVVAHHEQQDACWGYPPELLAGLTPREHRDAFHEIRSPVGGTILASFAAGGRWVAALQLYRREPGREFARTDVAFLRLLAPTIGRALAAALARERALATTAGPDASGILVLDPDRRVQLLTPAAETWGRLLRDAGGTGESSLPTAVWSAIAGLQAAGDARVAGRVMAVTAAGQVQIEASPAGPDGSIAVVFAPRRPPAPPELPPDWPLTQQESQVVVLVLRGLGDRQIAEQLFVTENTVRTHLRHIYDKLDVGSRTQLFARYFRETIWPGLDG
jgi:DNA-binding CsgD family transcriptional regulator